jgi:phosphate:Na+ symporter
MIIPSGISIGSEDSGFLEKSALKTPYLAIELTMAELGRMAKLLRRMLEGVKKSLLSDEHGVDETHAELTIIQGIEMREEKIDFLEKEITSYLILLTRENLTENQSGEVFELISIVRIMEAMGDIIHHNMFPLIAKKRGKRIDFSAEGKEDIITYQRKIFNQLIRLEELFRERKLSKGEKILSKKTAHADLDEGYRKRHLERVYEAKQASIATHEMHMEIMDHFKQINNQVMEIALSMIRLSEKTEG